MTLTVVSSGVADSERRQVVKELLERKGRQRRLESHLVFMKPARPEHTRTVTVTVHSHANTLGLDQIINNWSGFQSNLIAPRGWEDAAWRHKCAQPFSRSAICSTTETLNCADFDTYSGSRSLIFAICWAMFSFTADICPFRSRNRSLSPPWWDGAESAPTQAALRFLSVTSQSPEWAAGWTDACDRKCTKH